MRKVVLGMQVSLDGFVAGPNGELDWIWRTFNDELKELIVGGLRDMDTYLLGRVNYHEQAAHWPTSTDEIAPLINDMTKIVFSETLDRVEWANARLATADPATEIAQLKQRSGKNIAVAGGARFVQSLSRLGLIDEYSLIVHPLALGTGLPLFPGLPEPISMRLISIKHFDTGAFHVRYRRA
ncbi:dihydrofolate reductase family protein [Acrocarpospora macrocephala]|uniref:Riboflavin biosynthesis protein RibD n=1 Tax=Acrocarpospora macrocephala TaxID=150177 RepID=A0A5M3WHA2_9ACTN|nr:dihydrofolate reductase family protein [Acrocarpospora macrocephala]GES08354.1 riboflavin biosynthesis protein RibD [Acrocarpospora macrocephala]